MTERGTAATLLDAAEAAFAQHGIADASLRQIMRSAGANPAAVHYHYGSREALARAVLERVLRPLNERRLGLLDELEAEQQDSAPGIEALLEALVRPDLEAAVALGARNPAGAPLVGTIYLQPERFVTALVEEHFAPVARRFAPAMLAALPGMDFSTLSWRVRWCVFPMVGALLSEDGPSVERDTLEATLERIVAVGAGALAASAPRVGDRHGR